MKWMENHKKSQINLQEITMKWMETIGKQLSWGGLIAHFLRIPWIIAFTVSRTGSTRTWTHAVRGNVPALHEDRMPERRLRHEAQKKLALPRQLALRRRPLRKGARVLQQQKAHRSARACLERRRFGVQLTAKASKQKLRGSANPCVPTYSSST